MYGVPPNDPRFLDITEDEIIQDLLVRRYHSILLEDPATRQHRDLVTDPERMQALIQRTAAMMEQERHVRALRVLAQGGKTDSETAKKPLSLRVRGGATGPRVPRRPTKP